MAQVDDLTRTLIDDYGDYALSYPAIRLTGLDRSMPELIMDCVASARGIAISDRPRHLKLTRRLDIAGNLHTALFARWWRFRIRDRALAELPKALDAAKKRPEPNGALTD